MRQFVQVPVPFVQTAKDAMHLSFLTEPRQTRGFFYLFLPVLLAGPDFIYEYHFVAGNC